MQVTGGKGILRLLKMLQCMNEQTVFQFRPPTVIQILDFFTVLQSNFTIIDKSWTMTVNTSLRHRSVLRILKVWVSIGLHSQSTISQKTLEAQTVMAILQQQHVSFLMY